MAAPATAATRRLPVAIVLMGVSGSGKTTIGQALARQCRWDFVDADDLHPPANIARMRAGQPLSDADRAPWLAAIKARIDRARQERAGPARARQELAQAPEQGQPLVLACSALKRAYRAGLAEEHPDGMRDDVMFVWLHGAPELIRSRLVERQGHFMAPDLLASQLATLEPPTPGEDILAVDVDAAPAQIVRRIVTALKCAPRPLTAVPEPD